MSQTSLDKDKIKFLLLEGVHPNAVQVLKQAGYTNVELLASALEGEALKEKLADVHFVGIRSRTQLTADVLAAAPRLVAIGCFCIGTNQVDLQTARERGIAVFNAPYSNTRSVAELVLAEAILLLRGIPQKNAAAHRGGWLKTADNSFEARGKTLGIIGYGSIGSQLSVLAEAVGMNVIFYDVVAKLPLGNARAMPDMKSLLAAADIVTLHVPELPSTRWMIGAEEIAAMKPGAVLINAARGSVVRIEPLAEALKSGHVSGAAIDVFPTEPKSNKDEFQSPLRDFDQALLTPHIGGSTLEAQANIGLEVAEKLVKYSDNGTTTSSVNFPQVALPEHPGKKRLLHIHRNEPGVMTNINRTLADAGANIAAQYLQTLEGVGYVVVDIAADEVDASAMRAALDAIPGTIRSRVLF